MSVVTVGSGGGSACCFLKGAPEMVASHCVKESSKNCESRNSQLFSCGLSFQRSSDLFALHFVPGSTFSVYQHTPGVCEWGLQGPSACLQGAWCPDRPEQYWKVSSVRLLSRQFIYYFQKIDEISLLSFKKNFWTVHNVQCICWQGRCGGRFAVPGAVGDEEPGEAWKCRSHQHFETSTNPPRHGHWYENSIIIHCTFL